MKKFVKATCVAVTCLCLAVALAACGGSDVDGTYEVTQGEGASAMVITIELKDGTLTQTTTVGEQSLGTVTGTYETDGEKITLKAGEREITGTIKDGKLTVTMEGMGEITLVKK